MESVKVKEEPADENSLQIKAEPLDLEEDDSIDQNLFVPRIDFGVNNASETDDDNLRCPKCDIKYYSARSIKNHIQVCQVEDIFVKKEAVIDPEKSRPDRKNVKFGVKKLNQHEKNSIQILEKSCFVNDLKENEGKPLLLCA